MMVKPFSGIRDGSGNSACPNCWYHPNAVLIPGAIECPNCKVDIQWPSKDNEICQGCEGDGKVEDPQHGHSMTCGWCGGTGYKV